MVSGPFAPPPIKSECARVILSAVANTGPAKARLRPLSMSFSRLSSLGLFNSTPFRRASE